jgi:hypothetical protein
MANDDLYQPETVHIPQGRLPQQRHCTSVTSFPIYSRCAAGTGAQKEERSRDSRIDPNSSENSRGTRPSPSRECVTECENARTTGKDK